MIKLMLSSKSKIYKLCDIDPTIDDLTVLGRCISLWKCHPAGRPTEVYAMDMVFQDAQGNRVQATVRNKNISKFQLLIDEGSCYRIGNFGVGDNGGNYPLLNHRFKMNFYKNTSVTRVGNFDNNTRGFKFEPFANFSTKEFSPSDVVDVIGTVVSMTDCIPFNTFGVDKIRRTLILEDVDGVKLECCFFDAWAKKFDNFYEQRESLGHVVMILQLAKVKYTLVEGYDPKQKIISLFSPVKRELTPQEFFQGISLHFVRENSQNTPRTWMGVSRLAGLMWKTPLMKSVSSARSSSSDVVPIQTFEETPKSKGVSADRIESSSFSKCGNEHYHRLYIYNEEEEQSKKGKMVKVKTEPDE
ncbi:replication protein A 70 kDa DNA-binding subunit B [Tanacetum coccineum]|uniref:Replication protein A 70 kDa DNA-binding subunit B n=1 Tax=Tanacetum coccineum TaxID=301880 RepID=A0ABQ5CYW2_9ASTR